MKKIILFLLVASVVYANFFSEKARLDREVERLCATDGGIKVYETVALPAERFDEYGNVEITSKDFVKSDDEYYIEFKEINIREGNPRLIRFNARVIRISDGKIMGESIRYGRSGGDLPGPWHESSFGCPPLPMNLSSSIFLRER